MRARHPPTAARGRMAHLERNATANGVASNSRVSVERKGRHCESRRMRDAGNQQREQAAFRKTPDCPVRTEWREPHGMTGESGISFRPIVPCSKNWRAGDSFAKVLT